MPSNTSKTNNSNEDAFLFLSFWVAVVIECITLFKQEYHYYAFSRLWVVPILLIRLFRSHAYSKVNIYIWLSFLLGLSADITTIFGNYLVSYIGLSFFTLNYLSIGCFFHHLKANHNNSHLVFILVSILLIIINVLWIYAPELHFPVFFAQVIVHGFVISYCMFGVSLLKKKLSYKVINLFWGVVISILLTNTIYGIDILYFHRKYAILDSLVGLGHAVYLFLFTRSVLLYTKMNFNSIG